MNTPGVEAARHSGTIIYEGISDTPAQAKYDAAPGRQGSKAPINSDDSLT